MTITQDLLKELFDYQDGNLYWKMVKQGIKIGDRAGYDTNNGYRQVGINGKGYLEHRLIFLYHYGYLPKFLDHIDGDPSNNDISNLREATQQENCMNMKKPKSHNGKPTTSIYKGISWDKIDKKWKVSIRINGKPKHLGYFTSEIDAAKAYNKAAIEAFGKFAKINNIGVIK